MNMESDHPKVIYVTASGLLLLLVLVLLLLLLPLLLGPHDLFVCFSMLGLTLIRDSGLEFRGWGLALGVKGFVGQQAYYNNGILPLLGLLVKRNQYKKGYKGTAKLAGSSCFLQNALSEASQSVPENC